MDYPFSPVKDFAKLEAAIAGLYGEAQAPGQTERYRGLLRGLEEGRYRISAWRLTA